MTEQQYKTLRMLDTVQNINNDVVSTIDNFIHCANNDHRISLERHSVFGDTIKVLIRKKCLMKHYKVV